MNKTDGGPAFPEVSKGHLWESREGGQVIEFESAGGMSLRDYFAAKALQALLHPTHCDEALKEMKKRGETVGQMIRRAAVSAYRHADAMLEERTK